MKVSTKLFAFLLAPLLLVGLSSCGASADETAAVDKVLQGSICTASGTALLPGTPAELDGNKNIVLTMTNSQITNINGNKMTVTLNWTYDSSKFSDYIYRFTPVADDETHSIMEFNYPSVGKESVAFDFEATAICGAAKATAKFSANLNAETLIWDNMSISELYALNSESSNYAFVDTSTGYIKTNHSQDYYYVNISGKVTYLSSDGNWGIIADGDHSVEIYSGSAYDLKTGDYPDLAVGSYVTVSGDISQFNGCPQISFITKIRGMSDHSAIADPVDMGAISEASYKTWTQYSGIFHRIAQFNDVIYVGNVKNKDGTTITAATIVLTQRFTFDVKVGSTVLTVAFDYHTNADGGNGKNSDVATAIQDVILSAQINVTHLNIQGTLRYNTANASKKFENDGAYQITPIATTDVSAVA